MKSRVLRNPTAIGWYIIAAPPILAALMWAAQNTPAMQRLEALNMDFRFQARAGLDTPTSAPLVLVGIDEGSLETFGRWPWARSVHGDFCQIAGLANPSVVVMDLLFTEESTPNDDAYFGEAAANLPAFVSGALLEDPSGQTQGLNYPPGLTQPLPFEGAIEKVPGSHGAKLPIPAIGGRTHFGFINVEPTTADGVRRKLPLVLRVGTELYPSLPLQALMVYHGAAPDAVQVTLGRHIEFPGRSGPVRIPIDERGEMWINFRSKSVFPQASYSGLLTNLLRHHQQGEPLPAGFPELADRILIVGQVAPGLADLGPNPLAKLAPLVLVSLNTLNNVFLNDYLIVVDMWPWPLLGWIAMGWISLFLLRGRTTAQFVVWPVFLLVAYNVANFTAFAFHNLVLPLAPPVLGFILLHTGAIIVRWVEEQAEKRRVSASLQIEREARQVLEKELQIAQEIQKSMLRDDLPPGRSGIDLYASMEPAKLVGGDLYDYFYIDDRRLFFVVGDVAGKGVPAALFMTMALSVLRANALSSPDPGSILARSNNTLAMQNASCTFVTTFCGVLDLASGQLQYANGGHNPPLVLEASGNVRFLEQEGVALGPLEDIPYATRELQLAPGEGLLVYTDGVTEANDPAMEMYEEPRLETAAKAALALGTKAEVIARSVRADLAAFVNGAAQADDITLLVLRYCPDGPAPSIPVGGGEGI